MYFKSRFFLISGLKQVLKFKLLGNFVTRIKGSFTRIREGFRMNKGIDLENVMK